MDDGTPYVPEPAAPKQEPLDEVADYAMQLERSCAESADVGYDTNGGTAANVTDDNDVIVIDDDDDEPMVRKRLRVMGIWTDFMIDCRKQPLLSGLQRKSYRSRAKELSVATATSKGIPS